MTTDTTYHTPPPARAYEEYFGPAIFGPLSDVTLRQAGPTPGERVLDLACGTGIVARRVAAALGPDGRVVGVDVNPAMLAEAARWWSADATAVEWRLADGAGTGLPDAAFDLVVCQQGLQFFPDRLAGAGEIRRVLADDGRAVVTVWRGLEHHPLYEAMIEAELSHLEALGVVTRADLERPFSLDDPDELRALFTDAGFGHVTLTHETIEARFATPDRFVERMEYAYAAVVPTFAEDPAAFTEYLAAINAELAPVVEHHREGDHVVTRMHANVVAARP